MEKAMKIAENKIFIVEDKIKATQQSQNVINKIINNCDYDAFYVFNFNQVINQVMSVKKTLTRAEPTYLVKCNNESDLLKLLTSLDCNFSCVTKPEVAKVLSVCGDAEKVYLMNPIKPVSHIRHALQSQVSKIVFETEDELEKFQQLKFGGNVELIYNMGGMGTTKFGNNAIRDAPRVFSLAKKLNLTITGISICLEDVADLEPKFQEAKSLIQKATNLGFNINLLYISGELLNNESSHNPLNTTLTNYFPDPSLKVVCEFGGYLVKSAFTLACKILGKKYVNPEEILKNDNQIGHHDKGVFYYIYEGIYTSFTVSIFKQPETIPQPIKKYSTNEKLLPTTIWGCTCDSFDKVYNCIYLPDMDINDWLIFPKMGSLTFCATSGFNGFPLTSIIKIIDNSAYEVLKSHNEFFEENDFDQISTVLNRNNNQ